MFNTKSAYFYGVLLGDGHINYTKKAIANRDNKDDRRGPVMVLKATDYDFVEKWRNCIEDITGYKYAISEVQPRDKKHHMQYIVRCAKRWFVDEAEKETNHKTKIPIGIMKGLPEIQKEFLVGLMDSEGWVNMYLSSLSMCDLTLGFGCADDFFGDVYRMFQGLGIKVSKVYHRKPNRRKDGSLCKPLRLFRIDINDYLNAGMGFNIKRKTDRLAFISGILNDYTQSYPKYKDYFRGR